MKIFIAIGAGSFIGGVLRYLIAEYVQAKQVATFPLGTLTVNLIGSLLIGIVYGLAEKANLTQEWRLFIATGLLGGFTTFSAFSMETVELLRDGHFVSAAAYITLSVLLGLFCVYIGISLNKLF